MVPDRSKRPITAADMASLRWRGVSKRKRKQQAQAAANARWKAYRKAKRAAAK